MEGAEVEGAFSQNQPLSSTHVCEGYRIGGFHGFQLALNIKSTPLVNFVYYFVLASSELFLNMVMWLDSKFIIQWLHIAGK